MKRIEFYFNNDSAPHYYGEYEDKISDNVISRDFLGTRDFIFVDGVYYNKNSITTFKVVQVKE